MWHHNFAVKGSVWMKFGTQMLNHVEKQQILLKKKHSSLQRLLGLRTTSVNSQI